MTERMRIDKWLWAARFYKTRSLAAEDLGRGRVHVNGQEAKASREIKPGDVIDLRVAPSIRTIDVLALSAQRGPAPVAQALYRETEDSVKRREAALEQRRHEPALSLEQGRPTKRDRRELEDHRRGWNDRWSASID